MKSAKEISYAKLDWCLKIPINSYGLQGNLFCYDSCEVNNENASNSNLNGVFVEKNINDGKIWKRIRCVYNLGIFLIIGKHSVIRFVTIF